MAKKNRKEKKSQSERKAKKEEEAITWDDIAAMSDSDDEGGTGNGIELNTKAKSLQQAITKNIGSMLAMFKKTEASDGEEFEEDVLDGSISEEGDEDDAEVEVENDEELEEVGSGDEEEKEGDGESKTASFIDKIKNKSAVDEDGDSDSASDSDSDDEDEEAKKKSEQYTKLAKNNMMNSKALSVVATELDSFHSKMSWAETFVIVPPTPLPFGENGDPESNPLDIHDDLKREVAFYNSALEAVNEARPKLEESNIPFTRPDDFFAEMIKTDGKISRRNRYLFMFDFNRNFPNLVCFFSLVHRSHVQCERSSHFRKQKDRSRGTTKVEQGTKTSCQGIPRQPAGRKVQAKEGSLPRTRRLGKYCCEESWWCSPRRRG